MKQEFKEIYDYIIHSEDESKMQVLGSVTKELVNHMIENNPQYARQILDKLQAVKWKNFLTQKEAESILQKMKPKPDLSYPTWETMLRDFSFPEKDEPFYNKYALFITMCMIFSDSEKSIVEEFAANGVNIDKQNLFKFIHKLALDKLKDADGVFNIREYFKI